MVLIGGIIVDRFGTARRRSSSPIDLRDRRDRHGDLAALSGHGAGRLIFGLGAESMIVAITVAIGQWFVGRQLGFAFGVNLSIARAGSYSADMSTDLVQAALRPRLAAAAAGWQRGFRVIAVVAAWSTSCSSAAPRAASISRGRRRPIASSGAISGASIAPTGTSSACA